MGATPHQLPSRPRDTPKPDTASWAICCPRGAWPHIGRHSTPSYSIHRGSIRLWMAFRRFGLTAFLNGLGLLLKTKGHWLDSLKTKSRPLLDRSSQLPASRLLLGTRLVGLYRHLALFGAFSILGAVLVWPIFGHDYPPGVDTPTFLHLSWVTNLAVSGQLADPFQDPYWYGGFSYLVAYPPLGYGLVGILTVATRLELTVVYSGLLVLSIRGTRHGHLLARRRVRSTPLDGCFDWNSRGSGLSGAQRHIPLGLVYLGYGAGCPSRWSPSCYWNGR